MRGAAAIAVLVGVAGCGAPVQTPVGGSGPTGGTAATSTPSRGPAIALRPPGAVDVVADPPLTGPADPVVGVAYPYDLYVHCGIRSARFGERDWAPPSPPPEPVRYTAYARGTMTLAAPDVARFEEDGTGLRVDLRPATVTPPPCA